MPGKQRLFAVAHWLLKAVTAFSLFVIVILGLALGAICVAATNLDGNHFGIPASMDGVARIDALAIGALALSGGLACAILVLFVFRATTAIVDTAISGDPFVNENAQRLARIGWLLLALLAAEFLTNQTVNRLVTSLAAEHHVPVSTVGKFSFGSDVSPVGLLAILLIFVLGQIFRRGSEMRAELEGTV